MKGLRFGGRYEATGTVMKGGGGEVYVCEDPNLERTVVVKFLQDGVDKSRLLDEVAALQQIRSKNVVQILDTVQDPKRGIGIVAEYLPGTDLMDAKARPTDRVSFLRLAYQLSNGVQDIHEAGIIHRDLKPNNVKYGAENILKIFDFNLARDRSAAVTEGFVGTYGFAAPEQYSAGKVRFTPKVDIYSLCATLAFAALGGTLPAPLRTRPPDPGEWSPGFLSIGMVDKELAVLLNRGLSKNPATRPAAHEIRDLASALLRRGAHRALITVRGSAEVHTLSATSPVANIAHSKSGGGVIEIKYDGLGFRIAKLAGSVLINHAPCAVGQSLPDSCVIDLGSPTGSLSERLFVTFDLSHPEVVQ